MKHVNSRLLAVCVCMVFVALSSLYYYGLLCQFSPDGEMLVPILKMFSHLKSGTKYQEAELIFDICIYISTKIGGMSYFSVRLCTTMLYLFLLCGICFLCLNSLEDLEVKVYRIPLIAVFSVALFPVAANPKLFQFIEGADLIYQWPFNYHYASRIGVLLCLSILLLILRSKKRKWRMVYSIVLALSGFYFAKKTDLIFYLMFLAPFAIVIIMHALYEDKDRKYAVFIVSVGMGILLFCKILPIPWIKAVWNREVMSIYGIIYGATNWIAIEDIGQHLQEYIQLIFIDFNIQLPKTGLMNFYTVIDLFKLAFLIIGYILMFHIIKSEFMGMCKRYQYDCIDEIIAWGYFLLSCVFIFTEHGSLEYGKARYFSAFTAGMTILLCRNIEKFPIILGIEKSEKLFITKTRKFYFGYIFFVLCVCSMGKVWEDSVPNGYDDEFKAITEYIEHTDYGYAVAGYWLYPRLSAISEGRVIVWETETDVKTAYGEDAKVAYIITKNDGYSDGISGTVYDGCDNYEEICENYSEPTNIIRYERLQLLVFENGIRK